MTYNEAYDEAVRRCRESNMDCFISREHTLPPSESFKVEYATKPENTFGSDRMKERVTPQHPKMTRRAVD